ncbi:DUF3231 family protein [Cohnella abietis]|uniref:DUF3231 domain-containing protein n=1 Tax=Cohnella abietis TaxID=2507935 RepID=A0A3T1D3Z2_9BACL|nr:DUF3231 family protein [Cohnella abietis]BBI32827.1 hypothetical protein KCTCHS21_22260 [Cohnella abietis]
MGILSGNPKDEPMHYGEISSLWSASTVAKGIVSFYQGYLNHAGDKDLKKLIVDYIDQAKQEIKEIDEILQDNGIVAAPMMADRPKVNLEDIPVGARFTDQEITAALSADTAVGLVACSGAMAMSMREDIGVLFAKYHVARSLLGNKTLKLLKEKGWLIPPPLLVKRPEPVKV